MIAMSPGIQVTRDAAFATVALDNPGKLNALTLAMWETLAARIVELSKTKPRFIGR